MKRAILIGSTILVAAAGALLSRPRPQAFPHARHAGLFPTGCATCHEGIASGDSAKFISVTPETCAACHDGTSLPRIGWDGSAPAGVPNLRTVHPGHPDIGCAACHQAPGASGEMQVQAASFDNCKGCHAPDATDHRAEGVPCMQCHHPLTEVKAFTAEEIASLPAPPDHASDDFVLAHGAMAKENVDRCSVCHARQSCTTCHANAASIPAIQALKPDPRVASLVSTREWSPPVPASHQSADWVFEHADAMHADPTTCATCHTRETCATCHLEKTPEVAAPLGTSSSIRMKTSGLPVPGHTPNFSTAHGEAAVAALPKCAACHAETFCTSCHDASGRPEFHPVDFVQRHGAEAWGSTQQCSDCHSSEAFCRSCHAAQGFRVGKDVNAAFHDNQPDWLPSHAAAARQGLEACSSCHTQSSCLRCHSARDGFRINPHGPDFDPDQVQEKARESCSLCHFQSQLPGAP